MEKLFLSVKEYSETMNQSESLTRKQIKNGEVRFTRSGDRVLIPHDEPRRKFEQAFPESEAAS